MLHCPAMTSFFNTRSHYVGLELYVKSRLASNSSLLASASRVLVLKACDSTHGLITDFFGVGGVRDRRISVSPRKT